MNVLLIARSGPTPAPPTRPLPDTPDEPIPMPMPGDPPSGPPDNMSTVHV